MAKIENILVPDLGGSSKVDVIEINAQVGTQIKKEDALITLESDKASMEIPAPLGGKLVELLVKVGDKVSTGDLIAKVEVAGESAAAAEPVAAPAVAPNPPAPAAAPAAPAPVSQAVPTATKTGATAEEIYTSPAVRRLARELDLDLTQIAPTGRKGRLTREDLQNYVKLRMAQAGSGAGLAVAPMPQVDFSQFGDIETLALSRIKKLTAVNLHRNWVTIPHVTQFDEADITELESFRQRHKNIAEKSGVKLTPLVFLMKALVAALKAYPNFNASLAPDGASLIVKKYYHLGVAVDTPQGLVVPVIRNVDQKSLLELALELGEYSKRAREQKLTKEDMQGSSFSISSLGGVGGTAFTPIINAPDVAILGVSKMQTKPVYKNSVWEPRLMLPLSLSYDHRVIDGAEAARFINHLSQLLGDISQLLLH